jgi:methyl-accepting chemotaxis protein
MKKIIANLKVSTKLSMVGALFALTLGVLLYLYLNTRQEVITFAQTEIYGDEYVRPLRKLMEFVPTQKAMTHQLLEGVSKNKTEIDNSTSKIDNVFDQLLEADKKLSPEFTSPVSDNLKSLKSKWEETKSIGVNSNQDTVEKKYNELISQVRDMISSVGDASNLTLDPDLDSYYLMDIEIVKVPAIQDYISQAVILSNNIITKGNISPSETGRLMVLQDKIKDNISNIKKEIYVSFGNNPAKNVQPALESTVVNFIDGTNNFLDLLDKKILSSSGISLTREEVNTAGSKIFDASFEFWDKGIVQLDFVLNHRIDVYTGNKYYALISIAFIFSLSLFLFFLIYRLIVGPIKHLNKVVNEVTEGNLNTSAAINSKDELGQLGLHFNYMIDKMRKIIDDLETEKTSVEQKIEAAIRESEEQKDYFARSVDTMLHVMDKFADGDLRVELSVESNNEVGKLFDGFNKSTQRMNGLLSSVIDLIQSAASASSQISASSEQLAAGTREQSSQTVEVAGAVEEMAKTIIENTQNAEQAAAYSMEAGKLAREGGVVVEGTIEGIKKISEVVFEATEKVKSLGENSSQIGEIIQVIDDIADQTNLLALNAAIEAARAGEQGRGFAVVADEVRKLADRTTKATKEIAQMIKQIQSDTSVTVKSINQGANEAESGKILAENAGKSLNDIITASEKVVSIVNIVANANKEQSNAAEQISRSVERISTVIDQTSAGVQQIARSSEEMHHMTQDLQSLISNFKLKKFSMEEVSV